MVYIPAASRFLCHFRSHSSTQEQADYAWSVCCQNKLGRISKNILFLWRNAAGAEVDYTVIYVIIYGRAGA